MNEREMAYALTGGQKPEMNHVLGVAAVLMSTMLEEAEKAGDKDTIKYVVTMTLMMEKVRHHFEGADSGPSPEGDADMAAAMQAMRHGPTH